MADRAASAAYDRESLTPVGSEPLAASTNNHECPMLPFDPNIVLNAILYWSILAIFNAFGVKFAGIVVLRVKQL